jgi:hypothetical protein
MAGKYGSASVGLLVGGVNLIAARIQSFRHKIEALSEVCHGVGTAWEEYCPTGTLKVEIEQQGAYFDTSTANIHASFSATPGANTPQTVDKVVCAYFGGNTLAQPFVGLLGTLIGTYEVLGIVGALTRANLGYVASGISEWGHIVRTHATVTAAGDTEATSVDNTAVEQRVIPITSNSMAAASVVTTPVPHGLTTGDTVLIAGVATSSPTINGERTVTVLSTTTFSVPVDTSAGAAGTGGTFTRGKTQGGGSGYLQVTAITLGGYDDAVVTFRHSADNVTFANLVAMTAVTAVGAERKTVAGTVNRYVAQSVAFTGAGSDPSLTYFAGFARN